ncbi:MAG: 30S ribosomal protein S17 [Leptonema sp. (in: bacteria)]
MAENNTKKNKILKLVKGTVISDKMNKTRVILVEKKMMHPLYKKTIMRSAKIKVHDEENKSKIGDVILALETRPLSKHKRHILYKIIQKGDEQ